MGALPVAATVQQSAGPQHCSLCFQALDKQAEVRALHRALQQQQARCAHKDRVIAGLLAELAAMMRRCRAAEVRLRTRCPIPVPLPPLAIASGQEEGSDVVDLTAAMLAAAAPEQQKQMLGERLCPLVQDLQPELAAKITGMLLEMDNSEVLALLDSPDALSSKVDEAIMVLREHNALPDLEDETSELPRARLAFVAHDEQKKMLGERLFWKVQQLLPKFGLAGKVTGMLLDMENSDLLILLAVPHVLFIMVEEAIMVLKLHNRLPEGFTMPGSDVAN